jgi:sulfur-oxidizing protein SoxA
MGQQACSSCHGDAEITMKGIAARFPRYSSGKLMNLEMRINTCRTLHQADLQSGAKQFHQRIGQINVSCAQCHDARWGQKLAGVTIPQAHPTGYPIYRLEWQSVGSLQRRLRNCMTAVRAEPHDYGSPELLRLELYLAWRARGMPMETPAVRP